MSEIGADFRITFDDDEGDDELRRQQLEEELGFEIVLDSPTDALDSLEVSRDTTPDSAAQFYKDVDTLAVDSDLVRESPEVARTAAQRIEDAESLQGRGVTTKFLADPKNADVASDSVKELSRIEGLGNSIVRSWLNIKEVRAGYKFEEEAEDFADANRSFTEILITYDNPDQPLDTPDTVDFLGATYRWATSRIFDPDPGAYIGAQQDLSAIVEKRAQYGMSAPAQNWMKSVEQEESFLGKLGAAASDLKGLMAFSTEIGIEFLPQMLAAGATTLVTRNPQAGQAVFATASYAQERYRSPIEFLQKAGIDFSDPDSINRILTDQTLLEEAKEHGFKRATFIASVDMLTGGVAGRALADNPVSDLVLQTLVQMGGGAAGEAGAQVSSTGGIENVNEIIFEAVGEFASTPIDIVTLGGRPVLGMLKDKQKTSRAGGLVEALDKQVQALAESPLTERSPEAAGQHVAEVYIEQGVEEVYINLAALEALENSQEVIEQLGATEQAANATLYGGSVTVDIEVFAAQVMTNPELYGQVREGVKFEADALSAQEAVEIDEETTQEIEEAIGATGQEVQGDSQREGESGEASTEAQVSRDTAELLGKTREARAAELIAELDDAQVTPEVVQEALQQVDLAEHEAGIDGIFKTAKEAGMTENEYASYLQMRVKQRMESVKRVVKASVRKRQKVVQKKYKEAEAASRVKANEELMVDPVWKAYHAIGAAILSDAPASNDRRLSYGSVLEAFMGDEKAVEALPRFKGRRLYVPKGARTPGIDAAWYADLYGLENADALLFPLLHRPNFNESVEARAQELMREDFGGLVDVKMQLEETMAELHKSDLSGAVIAFELARLRQMRGQKRLQRTFIQKRAKEAIAGWRVGEIRPNVLEQQQRLEARRAAKALRAGDLEAAAKHKLNQLTAYEMTREAYKIQRQLEKGNKFLKKYAKEKPRRRGKVSGIPIEYREQIRAVLDAFNFKARSSRERRLQRSLDDPGRDIAQLPGESLTAWARRKKDEQGIIVDLGPTVMQADGRKSWQSLTFAEWADIKNTAKAIETAGRDANKQRKMVEGVGLDEIASGIADNVLSNLRQNQPDTAPADTEAGPISAYHDVATSVASAWNSSRQNIASIVFNADSYLRELDNFESMAETHKYIKGGIDRAFTEGYMPHQTGYLRRMKKASEQLVALYDTFSKGERNGMRKKEKINGVRTLLTREQQVTVVLNMGNAENIAAMTTGKDNRLPQFTEMELQAIMNHVPKKYFDFAQQTWDFLGEFSPEIQESVRRRQNRDAVMVEAQPIQTKHGLYRGGYYPLVYDLGKAASKRKKEDTDTQEARDKMLKGGFTTNHTNDYHTTTRTRASGTPLNLSMFNLNSHVQQVIYDLEMGDAVHDAWRVLNHQKVRQSFADAGRTDVHKALNLWMDDVITGEQHRGAFMERVLRHIRIGTTISKLGFSLTTASLQPLGLLQSSALVGKANMMHGLMQVVSHPRKVWGEVANQSGFMAEREQSFNKDIQLARQGVQNGLLERVAGTKGANLIRNSMFYFIAKMQRFVDVTTWLAARRQGMQNFPDDPARASAHADRMVARTQGSGNFHERTPFERGTISESVTNTEWVRVWSVFFSYFGAKANVAWERTRTTNFKSPMEVMDYMTDMALLYVVEGLAATWLKNGLELPLEDEDGDGSEWDDLVSMMMWEGFKGFAAGLPMARESISAAEGFSTGGAPGGFLDSLGRAGTQLSKDEWDIGTLKAVNNVAGTLLRYPTSQVNRTGQAIWESAVEDEDVEWVEYISGPRRD